MDNVIPSTLAQVVVVSIAAVLASSGFWAYMSKRDHAKSATTRLLMGLAYDKIFYLGMRYIDRGWISKDEYEDFAKYFYDPYKELGGNGTAERIMEEVKRLPLRSKKLHELIDSAKKTGQENFSD